MRKYAYGLTAVAVACSSTLAAAQQPVEKQETRQQARDTRHDRADKNTEEQLTRYFAGKLILMNECTIAMSELAQQRASSDEVKQFAQMLAQGHSQLNDNIAQIAPEAAAIVKLEGERRKHAAGLRGIPEDADRTPDATDRSNAADRKENKAERHANRREQQAEKAKHHAMKAGEGAAMHQILMIEQEAAQNFLNATTRMLEQYQGQDFDMGFLGFQIGAHTWALAELKAMQSVGGDEFQQLVAQTTQNVEQHLEQARQLAKKLEGKEHTDSSGATSNQ